MIPKELIKEYKIESITMFVAGALFLVSTLEFFWAMGPNGLYWRFYLWIIPFVLSSIRRRTSSLIGDIKKLRGKS
ncbi:MAG: hypothetical protein ACRECH_02555 [Nitrososphaerales archaeon]